MNIILKVSLQDDVVTLSRDIRIKNGEEFHLSKLLHLFEHIRIYINEMDDRPNIKVHPEFDYWEIEADDYKIKNIVVYPEKKRVVEDVVAATMEVFGELYPHIDMDGSRKQGVVLAKKIAVVACKAICDGTLGEFGYSVYGKHNKHDMVIYAIRKIQGFIETRDSQTLTFLYRLSDKLSEPNLITLIKQIQVRKNDRI